MGGIRELDALAVSFNQMAESLTLARALAHEYQAQLETRVDERTRQLQHLAEHDPLTGLPNRRQLMSYLQTTLENAARTNTQVAVFFLDLDNFKNINDSMGHAFGDFVLKGIAQRLRETIGERGFVARLGGDEFTVVCEIAAGCDATAKIGGELVRAFQKAPARRRARADDQRQRRSQRSIRTMSAARTPCCALRMPRCFTPRHRDVPG